MAKQLAGPEPEPEPEPELLAGGSFGCRLLNMGRFSALVASLCCPICKELSLLLKEKSSFLGTIGFNSRLEVECSNCDKLVASEKASNVIGSRKCELNLRAVAAARNCGFGYDKLVRFFAGLDVPQPMHLKTFQRINGQVHDAAELAVEDCFERTAKAIREHYMRLDDSLTNECTIPLVVSYDGTWHKRGHSSHHGIGVIIEVHTGFVLDYHIISTYCQGCANGPRRTSPLYAAWLKKHKDVCQKNYEGSAPSMEVAASEVLFRRSVEKYNFKYLTVLCDGDAKAVDRINDGNVYEEHVSKEDCVNHIAKRMWHGIEVVKKKLKGTSLSITGKGKVTDKLQKRLTNYYAKALRTNAPDVVAMKEGAYASIMHMMSTDENPQHTFCPPGEKSWCHYARETATGQARGKHTASLKRECGEQLFGIYDRLTKPELLKRCIRMKTQNANECFNGQIWRRCPKTDNIGLKTVETAAAMATLEFNMGPQGLGEVITTLGMKTGTNLAAHMKKAAVTRTARAKRKSAVATIQKRKQRKLDKAGLSDVRQEREGVIYESGGFNS